MTPRLVERGAFQPIGVRNGRTLYRVTERVVYESALLPKQIVVPVDFIFDGASVPRWPVIFWLTGGYALVAAAIHDWWYQHPDLDDRKLGDDLFHEVMEVAQDPPEGWRRWLMWAGVRAGGWLPWRRYEKRQKDLNPEWTETAAWPKPLEAKPPAWLKGAEYGTPPGYWQA